MEEIKKTDRCRKTNLEAGVMIYDLHRSAAGRTVGFL
jgi:hypothetical protein